MGLTSTLGSAGLPASAHVYLARLVELDWWPAILDTIGALLGWAGSARCPVPDMQCHHMLHMMGEHMLWLLEHEGL